MRAISVKKKTSNFRGVERTLKEKVMVPNFFRGQRLAMRAADATPCEALSHEGGP